MSEKLFLLGEEHPEYIKVKDVYELLDDLLVCTNSENGVINLTINNLKLALKIALENSKQINVERRKT